MDTPTTAAVCLENLGKLPVTAASWRGTPDGAAIPLTLRVWVGWLMSHWGSHAVWHKLWASCRGHVKRSPATPVCQPAGWTCRVCHVQRASSLSISPLLKVLLLHYVKSESPSIHGHRTLRPQRHTKIFIQNNPQFTVYQRITCVFFWHLLLNSWQLNLSSIFTVLPLTSLKDSFTAYIIAGELRTVKL